ncbi:MAG: transcription-repair coupling factor [Candidatus Hydrogenedens sp.]|nr:transcription-repair coupling factor [Candidatus Hydrogenedens sp.]
MSLKLPHLKITETLAGHLKKGGHPEVEVIGPWGSSKALVAHQVAEALGRPLLVLTAGRIDAESVYDDLSTFAGEDRVALFPAWEVLPSDTMNPSDDIIAERMDTLRRLSASFEGSRPLHAVVPLRSMLQRVISRKRLEGDIFELKTGVEYDLNDLLERLIKLGYTREVMVENRGEVSVRGGIVDIFPISAELPYRIEFFGDELESIRRFEPETQRSVSHEDAVQILPRSEKSILTRLSTQDGGLALLTQYFPADTLVVFDEPAAIYEEAQLLAKQFPDSPHVVDWQDAESALRKFARMMIAQVGYDASPEVPRVKMPTTSVKGFAGHTQDFWEQLKQWDLDGYTVQLLCANAGERRRLMELIEEHGYRLGQDSFDLRLGLGRLRAGFTVTQDKLAVLSEQEMFGRHYVRRKRRRFEAGAAITQFSDLKAGDYVVHAEHGIGRYVGLKRFEGRTGDFLTLQYRGGDTIYVPVTQIDQVQKYTAGEGAVPRVDKIGGAGWRTAKARVKKAVREMTEELVRLYAARDRSEGFAFSPDTPWQTEFEDSFQYDETPDQLRAIEDVKRDMESPRPMDRLLCGDVGYGKTEVALRAAFKAVQDGKQVAVLAPTTVLTQQHFNTFTERMADFPVRIDLMNRFRGDKEIRSTIERLKSGEVDIVIGTHRIVSGDVHFKDLGLIIVDEEQRFGVKHKEKLKQLRAHVDVLAMSATPIPRTLHFSLIGVRDMSVINTAPNDRLPIHTCIEAWNANLIKEAIEREMAREGQVFFLHNRVQTIEQVASQINQLVPRAKIAVGHGQMHRHELEEVMARFIEREVDVLVCTTIIGSGIDIPNANTIIVDRSDHFGLAELYQIRGRVGRYKHRAFAYLLVPGDRALTEEAQERLKALEDFSSLGSGFRIAMRDLEIRGAGNLLGADQSGHISTVGYETYREIIEEAVAEHRGQAPRRVQLPAFNLSVDAHIPEAYVPTAQQKMTLYRRIAHLKSMDEVEEMANELKDRFGAPPAPVKRLLEVMRARARAADAGVKFMSASEGVVSVTLDASRMIPHEQQAALKQAFGPALEIHWASAPLLKLAHGDESPAKAVLPLLDILAEEE